jgi:DNA primase
MSAPETTASIRASVDFRELVIDYGHEVNRSGKIRCSAHEDKTPSCHIYSDHSFCFSCGAYHDAFSFVAMQEHVEFPEAVEILSRKLALPLNTTSRASAPIPRRNEPEKWHPYVMSADERRYCVVMAEALLRDERAVKGIAKARNSQPETIHNLALDPCIGLDDGKLVYLYSTGAKMRCKPLTPARAQTFTGAPYLWLFGAQHALWRADRILPCTECIHIVEGETAAISLVDAGIDNGVSEIAVAVPGARAWRNEWAALFKGKEVTLWPDADKPGEELAQRSVASLSKVAKSIEVVNLSSSETAQ